MLEVTAKASSIKLLDNTFIPYASFQEQIIELPSEKIE